MTHTINKTKKQSSKSIAIIGSGVSGLTCAHYLVQQHDVTLFEARDYLGGHVNTIDVELRQPKRFGKTTTETASVDTGFIVFNERTYPNFFRLLDELAVPFQQSEMGFSVKHPATNFEYSGHTLNTLLAQRKNALSPKFWQFTKNIVDFNQHIKTLRADFDNLTEQLSQLKDKQATLTTDIDNNSNSIQNTNKGCFFNKRKNKKQLTQKLTDVNNCITKTQAQIHRLTSETLGQYLANATYGKLFQDNYLLPMVSAIWSMGLEDSKAFPLIFFAQFFDNHGLLDLKDRPQWFTIKGGSKQYVNKLVANYAKQGGSAKVSAPVQSVARNDDGVTVNYVQDNISYSKQFDDVIFACHADVAKKLLLDISERESEVLGAFDYTDNEAILHTDTQALPKKTLAWASWNYLLSSSKKDNTVSDVKPVLTYHMNILQRLVKQHNYLVTLNHEVADAQVIKRINYRHPVYNVSMTQAQQQWADISGENSVQGRTHFCGAYWFNAFHEDGVRSALRVCQSIGSDIDILNTVNPDHLANVQPSEQDFSYAKLPTKADKHLKTLAKRDVLKATENVNLNKLFEVK